MNMTSHTYLRPALSLFLLLSLVTGVAYPLVVTGVGQALFSDQAQGSLVRGDGQGVVGSRLIGQAFTDPGHFWSRPSATAPTPYNAANSGGSNLGPLNPALSDAIKGRVEALRQADPGNVQPIPVDLVTASGSGLDPHISLAAARYQVARVARARGLPREAVQALVERHAEQPWLGFLGEPRVNVLALNLELDSLNKAPAQVGKAAS
ncbi:MAG: potassium-transporting ATPase subunit C [Burkholderiales bacterium RIFCSPHIGHO2_01_FULL_63_240]|jgi:potassium-transporting ATPase KdpC subunit|nr:MAG: potassium-transporting ATPase subunit C [Burkholderiales bacterium RIFCSPHIGHO2_01_FULL_63_240]